MDTKGKNATNFIRLQPKTNFNLIKKYVKIKIFQKPSEDTKILEFTQYGNLIKHHLLLMENLNL